jgi:hypothetical protein
VRDDGGSVLLDPAAAERVVREVGRVAAEESEVGERRPLAEEVRAGGEVRAQLEDLREM